MISMQKQTNDPEWIFLNRLSILAGLCQFELDKEVIKHYDTHLSEIGYMTLSEALGEIINTRGSRDPFPSITQIMSACGEDDGNIKTETLIGSIITVFKKYGRLPSDVDIWDLRVFKPYQSLKFAVIAECGEEALDSIELMGGWITAYDTWATCDKQTVFRAQLRTVVTSVLDDRKRVLRSRLCIGKPSPSEPPRFRGHSQGRAEK